MGDLSGSKKLKINGGKLRVLDDGHLFHCIRRKYQSAFLTAQTSFMCFKHVFMVVSIIDYMFQVYLTILK